MHVPSWFGKVAIGYTLLLLLIVADALHVAQDVRDQQLVREEQIVANMLDSFKTLKTLPAQSISLILGVDMTKFPSLPWQSESYAWRQLGQRRTFELLTPTDIAQDVRNAGGPPFENRVLSLADGNFIFRNPPDNVLVYSPEGKLVSVKPFKNSTPPSEFEIAKLIPEVATALGGRTVSRLSGPERAQFEDRAAYWGLWNIEDGVPGIASYDSAFLKRSRAALSALAKLSFRGQLIDDSLGSGTTRILLTWSAPSVSAIEIRLNAPDGPLLYNRGPIGSTEFGNWISPKTRFFLQNASLGKTATAANTLAVVDVSQVQAASNEFFADPNPVILEAGQTLGITELHWNVPYRYTKVHLNSIDGPVVATGGSIGDVHSGKWVSDGLKFVLETRGLVDRAGRKSSEYAVTMKALLRSQIVDKSDHGPFDTIVQFFKDLFR